MKKEREDIENEEKFRRLTRNEKIMRMEEEDEERKRKGSIEKK